MDSVFVFKGQLQKFYAKYSRYVDKAVQFVLALVVFYTINRDIGFMKSLTNPVITLGLAVVCTFFPPVITVLGAAVMILLHMFSVSLGMMAVTAVIFLIMFIFYVRFTPKKAIFIMLVPIAFMLKIPYALPMAFGLIGTPAYVVPIVCGTFVYYMIDYVKDAAPTQTSVEGVAILDQVTTYARQVFRNKEMWLMIATFVLCLVIVYTVRRMSVDHSWKIAMIVGAICNIVIIGGGDMILDIGVSYMALIVGNVVAIVIGLILELLFFSVDYSRCEKIQFEDDEYYYYVKAVPKIVVAAPEKTVKRINKREKTSETEIIDTDEIRKKASGQSEKRSRTKKSQEKKVSSKTGNMDHLLLTQSLRKDFDLDK